MKQKYKFNGAEVIVVEQYIKATVDSIFKDLLLFVLLAVKNLKLLIKEIPIPRNKTDPEEIEQWLEYQVKVGNGGLKFELDMNICPFFVEDGLECLSKSEYYNNIANLVVLKLENDIENRAYEE